MTATEYIKSSKLSAADKKQISEVVAEYHRISDIAAATAGPRGGFDPNANKTALHAATEAARAELEANPTTEAAEKYHAAHLRELQASETQDAIRGALHGALVRTGKLLVPLAHRLIADAAAAAREKSASQRKALTEAQVDPQLVAAHDGKLAATLKNLEGEKAAAESNGVDWFTRHGLT
jgi:hypothetical protein